MAYLRPTGKLAKNDAEVSGGEKTSLNCAIDPFVLKKLNARYRDIPRDDISKLIDALIDDISMYDGIKEKYERKIKDLEAKYENLVAIRVASLKPALFPHQKEVTERSMLLQKVKYLEELLKTDEFEISRLKDLLKEKE